MPISSTSTMLSAALASILALGAMGCESEPRPWQGPPTSPSPLAAGRRYLEPATITASQLGKVHSIYVPIYSSLQRGGERVLINLAALLSVRNVSEDKSIVLTSITYYDSGGNRLREYLNSPAELGPMRTADFVVETDDEEGGTGANFLVKWGSLEDAPEPLIEAVMTGHVSNLSISLVGRGYNVD